MSGSDWSSDMELDINDINEEAAIRIVKSSNQAEISQFIKNLKKPSLNNLKFDLEPTDPVSILTTSYSPQGSKSNNAKTPLSQIRNNINDLFEDIKSPPRKHSDINERFSKFREKVKAKIEKIAQDQIEIQKKNCPFKPILINNKRSARNFDEFLSEMKKYEKSKFQNNMRLKNSKDKKGELVTHMPFVCKNSRKILEGKPESLQPVHDKLYNEKKLFSVKKDFKSENLLSFTPTLNMKSNCLKREANIDEILYEDAIRRQGKRSKSPEYVGPMKLISVNSEKLLADKFKEEFSACYSQLHEENLDLTYNEFVRVLEKMQFIHNDCEDLKYQMEKELVLKAWVKIAEKDSETISKSQIFDFLLAVMNYLPTKTSQNIHREFINFYEFRHLSVISHKVERIKTRCLTSASTPISSQAKNRLENFLEISELQKKWKNLKDQKPQNPNQPNFIPKIKRGPKTFLEKSFNDSDSISSEYLKFAEEQGSKSVHRTEILYNFSKLALEKAAICDKSLNDSPVPHKPPHRSTCEMSQVKGVSKLLEKLRKSKREQLRIPGFKLKLGLPLNIHSVGTQSPVSLDSHKSAVFSKQSSFGSDKSLL